jgi:lipopolysaccharide assembly protein A
VGWAMIRYLRYVFLALLGLSLLIVAMANRTVVSLQALPDDIAALIGVDLRIQLPLFLVIFGGIVTGLLIGFVWEWFREMKHRTVASRKTREVSRLERELAVMRDSETTPKDEILALLERPATKAR